MFPSPDQLSYARNFLWFSSTSRLCVVVVECCVCIGRSYLWILVAGEGVPGLVLACESSDASNRCSGSAHLHWHLCNIRGRVHLWLFLILFIDLSATKERVTESTGFGRMGLAGESQCVSKAPGSRTLPLGRREARELDGEGSPHWGEFQTLLRCGRCALAIQSRSPSFYMKAKCLTFTKSITNSELYYDQ